MANTKVFMGADSTFTVSDAADIFGETGNETLKVFNPTGLVNIGTATVERIELSDVQANYQYDMMGNSLSIYHFTGGAWVQMLVIPMATTSTPRLAFTDGSADLAYTGLDTATLGGTALPTTQGGITPATFDTTDKSSYTGGGTDPVVGQTYTLTTVAQTISMTTGNDTVDGSLANSVDGDALVDPSTTDADTATLKLTKAVTTAPTIANVEQIALAMDYFNPTLSVLGFSNGHVTVTTAQEGNSKATFQNIGAKGVTFAPSTGIETLTLDGTTATSDATTVTLKGGTLALNIGTTTALESVGLVSAGSSANTVTLDDNTSAAGANTYAVTGANDLTLNVAAADLNGDTITNGLDSGKTLAVNLTTLASNGDFKSVAANSFATKSTAGTLGANTLTFAAGTTSFTVNGADQLDNAASTLAATGTATTDVLNLTLAADQANIVASTFETVNLNYTSSTTDLALASLVGGTATSATSTFNIVSGRNVTLTSATAKAIDFSGMTGTAAATLTAMANTTANVSVTGTANADTLNLGANLTTGKGTVIAGAGNDTITGGAGDDSITAGDGNDSIASSAGNDSVDGGAGNDIINSGVGSNFLLGGTGDDSFLPGAGTDAIVAGAGDDTVTISAANITNADTFVGGEGTDTLAITTTIVTATSVLDNVSQFDVISFAAATAQSITAVDSLIDAGATLTVNVATPTGIFTWNGAAETNGNLKLTVAAANMAHVITGGAGADIITMGASTTGVSVKGGAGADTLTVGGIAAHTVNGGTGADTIDFGTSAIGVLQLLSTTESTTTSYDVVSNWTKNSEVVNLNGITGLTSVVAADVAQTVTVGGITTGLYIASTSGAFTSLSDAIARVGADVKTVGNAVVFNYGGDAYIFEDVDGAATTTNDILIKFVGVTATTLTDAANVLDIAS